MPDQHYDLRKRTRDNADNVKRERGFPTRAPWPPRQPSCVSCWAAPVCVFLDLELTEEQINRVCLVGPL